MTLVWSAWEPLSDLMTKEARRRILGKQGVYQIRWAVAGKPCKISRASGKDKNGILYIGSSGDLGNRIGKHVDILRGSKAGTFAKTYSLFNYGRKFRADQVEVRWVEALQYEKTEREPLNNYLREFLDTPPMNLTVGRLWPSRL